MKPLHHYWYTQNPLAWVLLPLSWLFHLIAELRRILYSNGILPSVCVAAPVVVVGNIVVGGSGKTPLLIALCELAKQLGYRPGVISRGYGGNAETAMLVNAHSNATKIGDEPLLIARRTQCPLAVGRDRVAAAELLLAQSDCNLIFSDDGLQHYRLQRDVEIAVVDAQRRFGNGYYLPAGPLRESVARLKSVDYVVVNGDAHAHHGYVLELGEAIRLDGDERKALSVFANQRVHAVAAIAHPQRFFDALQSLRIEVLAHEFADHHPFTRDDFNFSERLPLLMTEKDAVKCVALELVDAWYVPVSAQLSAALVSDISARLQQLMTTNHE